jgi:predicted CXXCH cytochrome family protein
MGYRIMKRKSRIVFLTALILAGFAGRSGALDVPHNGPRNPQSCQACHVSHSAAGAQITSVSGNANLCMSCHTSGGAASNKPLSESMEAIPGVSGSSHRWDGAMPLVSAPGNSFGLRSSADLSTAIFKSYLNAFGGVTVCSVCHDPHSESKAAWDPSSGPYTGMKGEDSGAATEAGLATAITDSNKASFWTENGWQNFSVRILTSATESNVGQARIITANTSTRLTLAAALPAAIQAGDRYEIIGRHFQRTAEDLNQPCEDCHYYRVQNHLRVEGEDAGYAADGVNVFSHPVGQALNANGKGYDRQAPLDGNGLPQSGARFAVGGEVPDNASNNLVTDGTGAVRCLTCHRVHSVDSNGLSVDLP